MKPLRMRGTALSLCLGTALATVLSASMDCPAQAATQAASNASTPATLLYREAVLGEGLEALHTRLDRQTTSAADPQARAAAFLLHAELRWLSGDADGALADADKALGAVTSYAPAMFKARLLDSQRRTAAAVIWYEKAAALAQSRPERDAARLRLALIAGTRRPEDLVNYASGAPAPARERLASVLALMGGEQAALDLMAQDTRPPTYEQALRLAGWAIDAGRPAQARSLAWSAYDLAATPDERSYALALVIESGRSGTAGDRGLPTIAQELAARPRSPQIAQARLDVLLESGRFDEAVALISQAREPQLRRRLPAVLELAGRKDALAAEYHRLIAAEPAVTRWYAGLALIHVEKGDMQGAAAVYRPLLTRPDLGIDALTTAARDMVAMGLADEALRAMTLLQDRPAFAVPVGFLLIDTFRGQGEDDKAQAMLDRLRRLLPAASPRRLDLADGYEALGRRDDAYAILIGLERASGTADYDQQVHIARLAATTGHDEEALSRWEALRRATELPARRSYLEQQVIAMAGKLGRREAMAEQLDARLAAGALDRRDLDLLVGLRLALRDRDGALAAVERFAAASGASDPARLKQLVTIYQRLRDQAGLDRTLKALIRADAANAETYLRQLILDTVRNPDAAQSPEQQAKGLRTLLARLSATGRMDNAEFARFSASAFALASLPGEAIGQFVRLTAMAPGDADAAAQLSNALAEAGRRDEAVARLQYIIETEPTGAAFVAGVNALLDILAQGGPGSDGTETGTQSSTMLLAWARRMVLERVAATGETPALDNLLADIAQQGGDFAQQLRSYDALLASAGDQRPTVLRQLVSLTSGSDPNDGGAGPMLADPARKAAYGRRLLAFDREYPPELYADIGRTLLAQGDMAGAEQAFARMNDMGGLVNVEQIKGAAYAGQGHVAQALDNYSRALARDGNNFDLIVRTSILREQNGQASMAHTWYLQSLERLVRMQPLVGDGTQAAAIDARHYYETLIEGLLLTWPNDAAASRTDLARLTRLFDDTVASVDATSAAGAAQRPRLDMIVRAVRRIAAAGRVFDWLAPMETKLAAVAGGQMEQLREAALYRDLTGLAEPVAEGADWPLRTLALQARDAGNAVLELALVLASGDEEAISAQVDAAIAQETRRRAAPSAPAEQSTGETPLLFGLLHEAAGWLDRSQVERLVLAPLARTAFSDAALFELFQFAPGRYARLESVAGRPLITGEHLIPMIGSPSPGRPKMWGTQGIQRLPLNELAAMISSRITTDQLVALYAQEARRAAGSGRQSAFQQPFLATLLRQPLGSRQQADLEEALKLLVAEERDPANPSAGPIVPDLIVLDTAPANRPLLLRTARFVANRYPDGRELPGLLEAWFAGAKEDAYRRLVALHAATSAHFRGPDYAATLTKTWFRDVEDRSLSAFLDAPSPDVDAAQAFYRNHVLAARNSVDPPAPQTTRRWYGKLVAVDPQNRTWVAGLLASILVQRDLPAFVTALEPYVAQHTNDVEAASVLQIAYDLQGRTQEMQAIVAQVGVDVREPGWLSEMVNRAAANRSGSGAPDMRQLFASLYAQWSTRNPKPTAVVELERIRATSAAAGAPSERDRGILAPLLDAATKDPASAASILRGLWRATAAGLGQPPSDQPSRNALLAALGSLTEPDHRQERAVLARTTGIADELEAELAQADPAAAAGLIQGQTGMMAAHRFLALLLSERGEALTKMAALAEAPRPGAHDIRLLAALSDATGRPLEPGQLEALTSRLRSLTALGPADRTLLGTLYARSGEGATAALLFEAATLQAMNQYTPTDDLDALLGMIVAALRSSPDRAGAEREHARIERIIDAQQGGPAITSDARRIVLPPLATTRVR